MSLEEIFAVFPIISQVLNIAIPSVIMTTLVSIFTISFVIGIVLFIIRIL